MAKSKIAEKKLKEKQPESRLVSENVHKLWYLYEFIFGVPDQHVCLTFCLLQFLKFVNFREYYSLEFSMWFLFAFGPYFLAEGLHLSGIMAVLFCGIVMSHYTHYNLTPVTQVTVQQTMRTVSFLAGTCMYVRGWFLF